MICLDTNIILYFASGTLSEDIIGAEPFCYASVTFIESLGYPDIMVAEERRIKELLSKMTEVPLSENIMVTAVKLRQLKKMSLGDAIISAAALENGGVLWTANTRDFHHVEGLTLVNPLNQ